MADHTARSERSNNTGRTQNSLLNRPQKNQLVSIINELNNAYTYGPSEFENLKKLKIKMRNEYEKTIQDMIIINKFLGSDEQTTKKLQGSYIFQKKKN